MSDDDFYPEIHVHHHQSVPDKPLLPRKAWWAIGVATVLLAAEFGYRMYDQAYSTEVLPRGISLTGVTIEGDVVEVALAPREPFRFLQFALTGERGDAADADAARIGIPALLDVREETGAHRTWSIPVRLRAAKKGIQRLAAVEGPLGFGNTTDTAIELGSRFRIDYDVIPLHSDGVTVEDLARIEFPAGTSLILRFALDFPLPKDTRLYLSYARAPRLLHQALLRP